MANGERTGDETPPQWFVVPYFYVDFRWVADRSAVAAADVQEALVCIKLTLDRFDILLINTGERAGLPDDLESARGMGRRSNCWSKALESEISATETRFAATWKIAPQWP